MSDLYELIKASAVVWSYAWPLAYLVGGYAAVMVVCSIVDRAQRR